MAGCAIPRTPIAVDFWKRRNTHQAKLFFLSHLHSDHTEGLSSSWNQKIYCSEITKSLAIVKFNINPCLLVSIPVGQSTILNLDETGIEKLTVTLIDANHCPGAVMFLFEGYFGRILYTGDFRYYEGMLDISPFNSNPIIDILYLDNTYCDPVCHFPTRAEATLMVLDIIRRHPSEDIVFGMDTLGKEDLLYKIALVLGVHVVVDEFRFQTTKLLGYSAVFTTDGNASHVRVVAKRHINKCNVSLWNKERPTIAILPTCLYEGSSNPFHNSEKIFVVAYSDHSSFPEMRNFVAGIKPKQIIPIVKSPRRFENEDCNSRMDMSVFIEQRCDQAMHVFDIPQSVQAFMSQNPENALTLSSLSKKRKTQSFFNNRSKKPCGVVFPSPQKFEKKMNSSERVIPNSIKQLTKVNFESLRSVADDNLSVLPALDLGVSDTNCSDAPHGKMVAEYVEGVSVVVTNSGQNENTGSSNGKSLTKGDALHSQEHIYRSTDIQGECECEDEKELCGDREETHYPKQPLYKDPAEDHPLETNSAKKSCKELEETCFTSTQDRHETLVEEGEKLHATQINDCQAELGRKGGETNTNTTTLGREGILDKEKNKTQTIKAHPVNSKKAMHQELEEIHATKMHYHPQAYSENQEIQATETPDRREISCEEQKEIRAMETQISLSKELHDHSETVDANSCERYSIKRAKDRRSSNIYGGSCAFALKVLEKLKAKKQSK